MLTDFAVRNYRSVRDVWLKLGPVNVIVGPNGAGKSNLYRAMYLMASTASGDFARSLADEGGMQSAIWAGKYLSGESLRLHLSITVDNLRYDLACGKDPRRIADPRNLSFFRFDPDIKTETVIDLSGGKHKTILKRRGSHIQARSGSGELTDYLMSVASNEPVLSGLKEPHLYPQLSRLRQELLSWRFYHQFRTDIDSPIRKPRVPVATPLMADDGSDLVLALATILEMGDDELLLSSLEDAFPGAELLIDETARGLRLKLQFPQFGRAFDASELSDGTLQYLCLLAVALSLKPPTLMAINEPESSIHSDLFEPLARLLCQASHTSQVWITTHSPELVDFILEYSGHDAIELEKVDGETRLVGRGLGGYKYEDDV